MPLIPELKIANNAYEKASALYYSEHNEELKRLEAEAEIIQERMKEIHAGVKEKLATHNEIVIMAERLQSVSLTGWYSDLRDSYPYKSNKIYHTRYALPRTDEFPEDWNEWYIKRAWLRFAFTEGHGRLCLSISNCRDHSGVYRFEIPYSEDVDLDECFRLADNLLISKGFHLTDILPE